MSSTTATACRLLSAAVIDDDRTRVVLGSCGGHSIGPARAFHPLARAHHRRLCSPRVEGLGEPGQEAGVSIIHRELGEPGP